MPDLKLIVSCGATVAAAAALVVGVELSRQYMQLVEANKMLQNENERLLKVSSERAKVSPREYRIVVRPCMMD